MLGYVRGQKTICQSFHVWNISRNYFIAAGHEGDGISLAAVTGKVIEELLKRKETIIPIEPLRLSRFTERVLNG